MEQVFDLYVSTLAAPYVAGSHTAVVTSASGLPASGNFTLTILDAGTGAVLVVLEVTAVTGTTLTVTAEGPDASAAALSVVKGAILSSRSIQALIDQAIAANAPANFFQPLTPPVPGGFTNQNFNVGSGVTTTRTDNTAPVTSISLLQHDPNATKNIVAVDKAVIGAGSFHLTIALSIGPGAGTNAEVGLYLSDGGGGPAIIIFGLQNGTGAPATGVMLAAFAFSNFTTFGSVVFQSGVVAANCRGRHQSNLFHLVGRHQFYAGVPGSGCYSLCDGPLWLWSRTSSGLGCQLRTDGYAVQLCGKHALKSAAGPRCERINSRQHGTAWYRTAWYRTAWRCVTGRKPGSRDRWLESGAARCDRNTLIGWRSHHGRFGAAPFTRGYDGCARSDRYAICCRCAN
jgi:hypothetical protein